LFFLYRAKKRKKYTSVIARFSPKMQEKTSFVVVDKRGFFDVKKRVKVYQSIERTP